MILKSNITPLLHLASVIRGVINCLHVYAILGHDHQEKIDS